MKASKTRALFLDRDGVINRPIFIRGRIYSPRYLNEFKVLPRVKQALEKAAKLNLKIIVFTNQPDIARGFSRKEDVEKIHGYLLKKYHVDDILVCPHDDKDRCKCRKPKPGMLFKAARKWKVDLKRSFVVGDRWKDVAAGNRAGCTTFLVNSNYYGKDKVVECDYTVDSLYYAVDMISKTMLKQKRRSKA